MDSSRPPQAAALVQAWLRAGPGSTLLAVGDTSASLLAEIGKEAPLGALHATAAPGDSPQRWLQALSSWPRFDAAVVSDLVESQPEPAAATVLAALRDVHAGRFLLLDSEAHPGSGRCTPADLLSLGLRRLGPAVLAGTTFDAYEYDMASYKRTPDWLNARHWAHPELWGRHRW